jgi:hypothetical protein
MGLAVILITFPTTALAETERQLGAHEHGAAMLTLAGEGETLLVGLDSPAYNLVGFEQSPTTDAQRADVEAVLAKLAQSDAVVSLPAAAECKLQGQRTTAQSWEGIESRGDAHHGDGHQDEHGHEEEHPEDEHHENDHPDEHAEDDHDQDHDHGHEESAHSDVLVEWTYRCENPGALQSVTVTAFEHFPNLTDLQVQYIGEGWQGATQLTPANTRINLD